VTLYKIDFTVPANTTKDNLFIRKLEISEDFLEKIYVRIPFGHRAKAHMHIRYGLDLFVPQPTTVVDAEGNRIKQNIEDLWIEGDNEFFEFPVFYTAPEVPFEITIEGYNESQYYDHTFYIYIIALPKKVALPFLIISEFVDLFKKLIGV